MIARIIVLAATLCLIADESSGQRYKRVVTRGSPAELLLDAAEESPEETRPAQWEEFLTVNPGHAANSWVLMRLQQAYLGNSDWGKALQAGERLLQLHPEDLDAALNCRRASAELKDKALEDTWKDRLRKIAARVVASDAKGEDPAERERVLTVARSLMKEASDESFQQAGSTQQVSKKIQALEEIVAKNEHPAQVKQAHVWLMQSYRSTGNAGKALTHGEAVIAGDPSNTEALLTVAQIYLDRRANYPVILGHTQRALDLLNRNVKPQYLSEEQWRNLKASQTGSAYLLMGNAYVSQNQFAAADKALRSAWPYFQTSETVASSILFFLGWSNYYMENYREAARFFQECIKNGGAYREQAVRQLNGLVREGRLRD